MKKNLKCDIESRREKKTLVKCEKVFYNYYCCLHQAERERVMCVL